MIIFGSKFICVLAFSRQVVAPVRETAAQLLGVLSLHLTTDQAVLVAKHLVYLASVDDDRVLSPGSSYGDGRTSWMVVHGGLLGIKYLLASRKVRTTWHVESERLCGYALVG